MCTCLAGNHLGTPSTLEAFLYRNHPSSCSSLGFHCWNSFCIQASDNFSASRCQPSGSLGYALESVLRPFDTTGIGIGEEITRGRNCDLHVPKRLSVLQVPASGSLRLLIYMVGIGCWPLCFIPIMTFLDGWVFHDLRSDHLFLSSWLPIVPAPSESVSHQFKSIIEGEAALRLPNATSMPPDFTSKPTWLTALSTRPVFETLNH